jgi:predicted lipid-binding transport protein (Tim44 family)
MAAPILAGALSSSAGARTTIVEAVRATSSPVTAANPGMTFASSGGVHGGLFAGMIVAVLLLSLWFKRIL